MVAALFDCLGDDNVTELLASNESYAVEIASQALLCDVDNEHDFSDTSADDSTETTMAPTDALP